MIPLNRVYHFYFSLQHAVHLRLEEEPLEQIRCHRAIIHMRVNIQPKHWQLARERLAQY